MALFLLSGFGGNDFLDAVADGGPLFEHGIE
jgi:hypothetical protein